MTITLTREEAQQLLDALEDIRYADISERQNKAIETLRARLAQPEREWVGLTVTEITEAAIGTSDDELDFAYAIEAKLRSKNT